MRPGIELLESRSEMKVAPFLMLVTVSKRCLSNMSCFPSWSSDPAGEESERPAMHRLHPEAGWYSMCEWHLKGWAKNQRSKVTFERRERSTVNNTYYITININYIL